LAPQNSIQAFGSPKFYFQAFDSPKIFNQALPLPLAIVQPLKHVSVASQHNSATAPLCVLLTTMEENNTSNRKEHDTGRTASLRN